MVYFIYSSETRKIKIGYSKSLAGVRSRMSTLQTGNWDKLELIGVINNDTIGLEKQLHSKFSDERLIGEWFAGSLTLLKYIENNNTEEINSTRVSDLVEAKQNDDLQDFKESARDGREARVESTTVKLTSKEEIIRRMMSSRVHLDKELKYQNYLLGKTK